MSANWVNAEVCELLSLQGEDRINWLKTEMLTAFYLSIYLSIYLFSFSPSLHLSYRLSVCSVTCCRSVTLGSLTSAPVCHLASVALADRHTERRCVITAVEDRNEEKTLCTCTECALQAKTAAALELKEWKRGRGVKLLQTWRCRCQTHHLLLNITLSKNV